MAARPAGRAMAEGELLPNSVVVELLEERLCGDGAQDIARNGWLLDGFPRTRLQAEALLTERRASLRPDAVVLIERPDELVKEFALGRCTDARTGQTYHPVYAPPPEELYDQLVWHVDDTYEALERRLADHKASIDGIVAAFEAGGVVRLEGDDDAVDARLVVGEPPPAPVVRRRAPLVMQLLGGGSPTTRRASTASSRLPRGRTASPSRRRCCIDQDARRDLGLPQGAVDGPAGEGARRARGAAARQDAQTAWGGTFPRPRHDRRHRRPALQRRGGVRVDVRVRRPGVPEGRAAVADGAAGGGGARDGGGAARCRRERRRGDVRRTRPRATAWCATARSARSRTRRRAAASARCWRRCAAATRTTRPTSCRCSSATTTRKSAGCRPQTLEALAPQLAVGATCELVDLCMLDEALSINDARERCGACVRLAPHAVSAQQATETIAAMVDDLVADGLIRAPRCATNCKTSTR